VRRRAEAPEIEIPPVDRLVEAERLDPPLQDVEPLLALRASDDLAEARNEDVHGADGPAVLVELHIEGLDLLRVVGDDEGAADHLLGEEFLVLALEIAAPVGLELEGLGRLLELFYRVGIGEAREGGGDHLGEHVDETALDALVEEGEILGAIRQGDPRQVLEKVLGEVHVVDDVAEGHLGLDHPELGEMASRVGVLGPEGRAEGVDAAQGLAVSLDVELARDGEGGRLAEEVLGVVHGLPGLGYPLEVEGRHLEHLARALRVGGGDEGRMDVVEAALLEELVHGEGHPVADAGHGAEGIGPGAEVGDLAEEFEGVRLLLQWIAVRGRLADDGQGADPDFQLLAGGRGGDEAALDADAGARRDAGELGGRGCCRGLVEDALHVPHARAVVHFEEHRGLGLALGADPALNGHGSSVRRQPENLFNRQAHEGDLLAR